MAEVRVTIDTQVPTANEIAEGIRRNLAALETVQFQEVTVRRPEGTLAFGGEQVVAFVAQHAGEIGNLATALINMVSLVLKLRAAAKTKPGAVIISIDNDQLKLPASNKKVKTYLSQLPKIKKASKKAAKEGAVVRRKKPRK